MNPVIHTLAWPFLDPGFLGNAGEVRGSDRAEQHDRFVRDRFSTLSLDVIRGTRRAVWGDVPGSDLDCLLRAIDQISTYYVTPQGGKLLLRDTPPGNSWLVPGVPVDPVEDWPYLSRFLWPAMICAAVWSGLDLGRDAVGCPADLQDDFRLLESLRRKGFGDYHIHPGAAMSLGQFLCRLPPCRSALEVVVGGKVGWLVETEKWADVEGFPRPLVNGHLLVLAQAFLAWIMEKGHAPRSTLPLYPELEAVLREEAEARKWWQTLWQLLTLPRPDERDQSILYQIDRLVRDLELDGDYVPRDAEGSALRPIDAAFLCQIWPQLRRPNSGSSRLPGLEFLTGKWLWLANYLYRFVTQQPGAPGLKNFKIWFNRLGDFAVTDFRREKDPIQSYVKTASGPVESVRRFEFRVVAGSSFSKTAELLVPNYLEATRQWNRQGRKVDLAFSLALNKGGKERDGLSRDDLSTGEIFGRENSGSRYAPTLRRYVRSVADFLGFIERWPEILFLFRGLDVLNVEQVVPNWVPGLVFQHFNAEVERVAYRQDDPPPPFRHTMHAGEDFMLPSDGLRRVYECVVLGPLRRNDRIGHGLILGLDLQAWIDRGPDRRFQTTRGALLDDLVWEWRLVSQGLVAGDPYRLETLIRSLQDRLRRKQKTGYRDDEMYEPQELWAAYQLRFDYQRLKALGLLSGPDWLARADLRLLDPEGKPGKILKEYLEGTLWEAEQSAEWVEGDDQMLQRWQRLQDYLVVTVERAGVAVEMCPSSNIVIGAFNDYRRHPVFQLFPVTRSPRLNLCVNSDDPVTFHTSVDREYRHLFRAALSQGFDENQVVHWLRKIHGMGRDYSFIPDDKSKRGRLGNMARREGWRLT